MTEITAHHGLFKVTNLHVHDTGGSGRPVVLVHGWPLSGEAFSEQVLPLVAANYGDGQQAEMRGLDGNLLLKISNHTYRVGGINRVQVQLADHSGHTAAAGCDFQASLPT